MATFGSKTRLSLAVLVLALGCLPSEGRAPPGRVLLMVSADRDLTSSFTTEDGWEIEYERFLLSLGNVWLDRTQLDDSCEPYSEALYLRLIDLHDSTPQRLSTLYATGNCIVRFQLLRPADDIPTRSEVSDELERFMRAKESDAFVRDGAVVVHIDGSARRADTTLTFSWSFRQAFDYETCNVISFESSGSQEVDLKIATLLLFRTDLDTESAEQRFDPYAAADADGDGAITLDELGTVSIDSVDGTTSLAERLYLELVPQLPRLEGHPPCFVGRLVGE